MQFSTYKVMIEGLDDITPNSKKSNLNVRRHRNKQRKTNEAARQRIQKEKEITANADIIFGLDNGATRNDSLHCLIPRWK